MSQPSKKGKFAMSQKEVNSSKYGSFVDLDDLVETLSDSFRKSYTNSILRPVGYLHGKMGHGWILLIKKEPTGDDKDYCVYLAGSQSRKDYTDFTLEDITFGSLSEIKAGDWVDFS